MSYPLDASVRSLWSGLALRANISSLYILLVSLLLDAWLSSAAAQTGGLIPYKSPDRPKLEEGGTSRQSIKTAKQGQEDVVLLK